MDKPDIILPPPFDWCSIPQGQVTLMPHGLDNELYLKQPMMVDVPAFYMAKYPITNKQYAEYIHHGGGAIPFYWDSPYWNGDDCPVVAMTWYEAVKFCRWLSDKTGAIIMLPTDAMWQRATQGDDNRTYPWGDVWDASLCNHNVDKAGIGKTTPVYQYEGKSDSPYGCVDMAGNIWEWCVTKYHTGENRLTGVHTDDRILRGGSWYTTYADRIGCLFSNRNNPLNGGYSNKGFRVACFANANFE